MEAQAVELGCKHQKCVRTSSLNFNSQGRSDEGPFFIDMAGAVCRRSCCNSALPWGAIPAIIDRAPLRAPPRPRYYAGGQGSP